MPILYKYLPLSRNEKDKNYSLINIEKNCLFFAKYNNLNDPFELLDEKGNKCENFRVVSLTNSYRKKLMRSHYANGHRGICIAIEVPENFISPVIYGTRKNLKNLEDLIKTGKIKTKKKVNISL